MARLELSMFGSFRAHLDGEPITAFESDKVRALLAYLAVEADRPHRREKLVGLLWPDWPERSARQNLSQALYNLRAAIGDRSAEPPFLCITPRTIQLNPEGDVRLDVAQLTGLSANSTPAEMEAAACAYDGPFLADFSLPDSAPFEAWCTATREKLQRLAQDTLLRLAGVYEASGDHDGALRHARRAAELDPCWELGHQAIMRALALSGDRSGALAQYERCRQALRQELEVEPTAETVSLYERIRDGELAAAAAPVPPEGIPLLHRPAFLQADASPRVTRQQTFVGRERQLARLGEFLETALTARGQVAFVAGGPGLGKTALMDAFARRAMASCPDLLVAMGRCNAYAGAGDPYHPFRDLMGMLTGDVESRWAASAITREHATRLWGAVRRASRALVEHGPNVIDILIPRTLLMARTRSAVPDEPLVGQLQALLERDRAAKAEMAQNQLFEEVTQVLCHLSQEQPLLLMLDDLQWADTASIGLLFHLGRRLEGGRVLILGAYRPEELALEYHGASSRERDRHPLEKVLTEFKRQHGNVWVDLEETEERETRTFIDAILDAEPNRLGADFRGSLFHHAGGHPLFTVELLRDMQERGNLVRDNAGQWVEGPSLDWGLLPARVEGVIEERISRLDDELRETLTIASVEGEEFTAQVVAQVAKIGERQVLRQLSGELEKRHMLLQEQQELRAGQRTLSRFRFSHLLFQRYLYNGLGAGERRLLHGEIAVALEELSAGDLERIAPQLARHFQEAGKSEKAIHYLIVAGDRARQQYAYQEAIDAYRPAVSLLRELGDFERAARTLMKLGLTYHTAFAFESARKAYQEGFALWLSRVPDQGAAQISPAPHPFRVGAFHPESIDPALCWDQPSFRVVRQLFSGLVEMSPELGVVPDLAQSWEVLDGGHKYIFYLCEGARWSDAVPVTAEDIAYAWKRVLDPRTNSSNASLLYDIRGAERFHRGEIDQEQVGVQALNENTLQVELEGPAGYFLHLLACTAFRPVPRHIVAEKGMEWLEAGEVITNGPFLLESWRPGECMTLARNPAYHGRFKGNLARVQLEFHTDDMKALEAFQAGQLDFMRLMTLSTMERVRWQIQNAEDYVTWPMHRTSSVRFDASKPPFHDARVRRAFSLAIDQETLVEIALKGLVSPATGGFVPPGMRGHSPGIGLPYDPHWANQLLTEAGYPPGADRAMMVENAVASVDYEPVAEYLHAQWRETLGIEVPWQILPWQEYLGAIRKAKPHLSLSGWIADYPDPDNFLRVAIPRQRTGWQHEVYEQLVEGAKRIADQGEREERYRQADRILVAEQAIVLPLYHDRFHALLKPWVRPVSALQVLRWKDIIMEPH